MITWSASPADTVTVALSFCVVPSGSFSFIFRLDLLRHEVVCVMNGKTNFGVLQVVSSAVVVPYGTQLTREEDNYVLTLWAFFKPCDKPNKTLSY